MAMIENCWQTVSLPEGKSPSLREFGPCWFHQTFTCPPRLPICNFGGGTSREHCCDHRWIPGAPGWVKISMRKTSENQWFLWENGLIMVRFLHLYVGV